MRSSRLFGIVALVAFLVVPGGAPVALAGRGTTTPTYTYVSLSDPARTQAYDAKGRLVATFTTGSRSVTLVGPSRTFADTVDGSSATVTTTAWVRLLPGAFAGTVDAAWLGARLKDTSPDVLAVAFQYVAGAPSISKNGLRIAGDADYGPLVSGVRQEGSDFNDYLGISWTYGATTDAPEAAQLRSLDCSGFVRMVLGYRLGLPLGYSDGTGATLPRRAAWMEAASPGVVLVPNDGTKPASASRSLLQAGDLVFFDAATDDGTAIDHVGIYVGVDGAGHQRFISSRKTPNGPTITDVGARSYLDGSGLYATGFRSARRP